MSDFIYYDRTKFETDVNEKALDKYIDRLIFNQALSVSQDAEVSTDIEACPLNYTTAKIPKKYIGDVRKTPEDQLPRSRGPGSNKRSRSRRSRDKSVEEDDIQFRDLPEDTELTQKDGKTMVTMTIDMLRGYMYTEVESRARYIHDYYERQWNEMNREKMALYTQLYEERRDARRMQEDIDKLRYSIEISRRAIEELNTKMNSSKEAKRRRRQAKKHRKQTTVIESTSDTGNSLPTVNPDNVESDSEQPFSEPDISLLYREERSGGGDGESGTSQQKKKAIIEEIDAEIKALVI
ncbi:hypothetical protein ACF0H5_012123 [Mactra antiquata]